MKTAVFAFFGLIVIVFSASVNVTSQEGAMAEGHGDVTSAVAADSTSGAASGAVEGDGAVVGMAQVGAALAGALSSPYL